MYIKGDSTIVQALLGGDIHAGYAGATPVAAAVARGGQVAIVAVPANRMGYLLVTREPIKDPRELSGKKFAISSFGGSSEIATRLGLEKVGADPNKVVMLQVGGSPDRIAALRRGSVDGSILSANEVIGAGGMGFYTLFDFTKSDLEYPYNVLYVRQAVCGRKKESDHRHGQIVHARPLVYAGQRERFGQNFCPMVENQRYRVPQTPVEIYRI